MRTLLPLGLLSVLAPLGCSAPTPAPGTSSVGGQSPAKNPPVWVTRAVPAPGVTHHVFACPSTKGNVSYHLYRPAAYADETRRFPVVYWLHGSGGGLPGIPVVARRFDAAITAGKLPPCLVVFVNGLEMGMYVDWADGSAPVESMIVRDLLPQLEALRASLPEQPTCGVETMRALRDASDG